MPDWLNMWYCASVRGRAGGNLYVVAPGRAIPDIGEVCFPVPAGPHETDFPMRLGPVLAHNNLKALACGPEAEIRHCSRGAPHATGPGVVVDNRGAVHPNDQRLGGAGASFPGDVMDRRGFVAAAGSGFMPSHAAEGRAVP